MTQAAETAPSGVPGDRGAAPSRPWSVWWRVYSLGLILMLVLAARACEQYTSEYQDLPAIAWLEAHPPLDESASLPSAMEIARGFNYAVPHLRPSGGPQPHLPTFALPGAMVRSVGGVRDAARLVKESPDPSPGADYAALTLEVAVFNRTLRAKSWADLRVTQLDLSHNETQIRRMTGPGVRDVVWIAEPLRMEAPQGGAIVVGYRGPIGFEIRSRSVRTSLDDPFLAAELSARAQQLALSGAAEWKAWLEAQPYWRSEWQG